jgi:hypothetical protein
VIVHKIRNINIRHYTLPLPIFTRYIWSTTLKAAIVCTLLACCATYGECSSYHSRIASQGHSVFINGAFAIAVVGRSGTSRADAASSILQESGARKVVARAVNRRRWDVETLNGDIVFRVTRVDSRLVRTTVPRLARSWAATINRLLSTPALTINVRQRPLVVPTGDSRSLTIGGMALTGDNSSATSAASIATVTFDQGTRAIRIQGLKPGLVNLTVQAQDDRGGSAEQQMSVLVEDRAGTIDSDLSATVTGSPASWNDILQAVRTAVYKSVSLHLGAYLEVVKQPLLTSSLTPGSTVTVPVDVRAVGSDLVPVEQNISVHVQNDDNLTPENAQTLFYSNNPETVRRPQSLFSAYLPALNRPVRLVFHHQNISSTGMVMRVELINTGNSTATVRIVRGLTAPVVNPVDAGAMAGTQFLREWLVNSGQVVDVPAQTRLELLELRTAPGYVASGIADITQVGGLPKTVLVHVAADSTDSFSFNGLASIAGLGDPSKTGMALLPLTTTYHASIASMAVSDEIYNTPSLSVTGSYAVGGPWMHMTIGTDRPIRQVTGNGSLLGNYGVIYNISITLSNPTAFRRQVVVSFESGAGAVSGAFYVVGDKMQTVNDLTPPNEQEIARATLGPGETQTIQIYTTPLSGSAYPAAITAHSL